jgi:hypothetical protein
LSAKADNKQKFLGIPLEKERVEVIGTPKQKTREKNLTNSSGAMRSSP